MRLLLIAPFYDKQTAGESWSTFKWVEGVSALHESVVLTTHKESWKIDGSPTKAASVVNWIDPSLPKSLQRLDWELKPTYILFYRRVRQWLRKTIAAGERFDLIHQINPLALRYPSPAAGLGIPFLIGPLAGSLPTPSGFAGESADRQWYRKLRNLDHFRIQRDPWLRQTYEEASAVIGVAPYVQDLLSKLKIKRFETMSETGIENIGTMLPKEASGSEPLRLLYVGRIIRTKGVVDAIRAFALARQKADIRLDIVGDGDMRAECTRLVESLGLTNEVSFHGRVPREEVNEWYKRSHVFLFPSFREPSGNVVFEAMSHGLPVITSDVGGPAYVVSESCGILVPAVSPDQFANDLSNAILKFCKDRPYLKLASEAALARIKDLASWDSKIRKIDALYKDLAQNEK